MKKLVVFQLGHEQYALDVNQIQSIERVMEITPVPQVENDYIKGIINLRGEVIPIIDLKENLNMGATEINNETRIIVTHFHEMSLGLLVDSASDVIDVDKTTIEASEQIIQDSKHHVIQG
ncbi:MAG TPA: chemotaxis protein CheW, partial [Bacillota bacterium]|nr:chemotaxis protein CheW [Bacillota bacterium]